MECIKEKLEKKDIEANFTLKETRSYPESKKNQKMVFEHKTIISGRCNLDHVNNCIKYKWSTQTKKKIKQFGFKKISK